MPMVTLHKMGEGNLYHMHVLDPHDPGFGGGRPQPPDPGYGQGRPGGRPDNTLPGSGAHPGNRPPGSGGGIPDHELPDTPPPQVAPGYTLVLVRHNMKWEYAVIAPGSPPPRPLPGPPNRPDAGLPGSQPGVDNTLPGGPPPYPGNVVPGQPVIGGGPAQPPPTYPTPGPVPPTPTPQR